MRAGVYQIVNTINGKTYVGSTINFKSRSNAHFADLRRGVHHSGRLQNAFRKYGAAAFEFRKLIICNPDMRIEFEQRAIDVFEPAYNIAKIALASMTGLRHSAETRARMSANSWTKGKKRPPELVAKTAAAHTGMKRSLEARAKMGEKAKGRVWTESAKAKLSANTTGRKLAPAHAAKLIGNKHATGHKHTQEWKDANAERMRGIPRPKSPEHRAKIAATLRGRKATPEHRANQAAAQLGKKRGPYNLKSRSKVDE